MQVTEQPIETKELHIVGSDFNCECQSFIKADIDLSNQDGTYLYTIKATLNIEAINGNSIEYECETSFRIETDGNKPNAVDLKGMANTGTLNMSKKLAAVIKDHTNYSAPPIFLINQKTLDELVQQELEKN